MKYKIFFAVIIIFIVLVALGDEKETSFSNIQNPALVGWTEYESNPVIKYGDTLKSMLWNDPSVLKENGLYKMWLSAGDPFSGNITVSIYYAESSDGINWDIQEKPIMVPSEGDWDSQSVETPSVIKVGSTYHMYYTGYNTDFSEARYSIGHATSKDGISWSKDPNNPIITPHENPLKWGFYTTAEPGVVYHKGTFFLYYASAKSNYPDPGSPFGILLATSKDGSSFTKKGAVHTLTSSYDSSKYRGYSTPMVYVKDEVFYMYHDVVYDPDGFDQVAISSAKSSDGKNFVETEVNIFTINGGDWKDYSTLGPTAIYDEGKVKIWFAGQKNAPGKGFDFGIGYAEKE
jgi:predicted GH43/DUF377 family glycosyl hydrolase